MELILEKIIIKNYRSNKKELVKKALFVTFASFASLKQEQNRPENDFDSSSAVLSNEAQQKDKQWAKIIKIIQNNQAQAGSKVFDALLVAISSPASLTYTLLRFLLFIRHCFNLKVVLIMAPECEKKVSNTGIVETVITAFSEKEAFQKLTRLDN